MTQNSSMARSYAWTVEPPRSSVGEAAGQLWRHRYTVKALCSAKANNLKYSRKETDHSAAEDDHLLKELGSGEAREPGKVGSGQSYTPTKQQHIRILAFRIRTARSCEVDYAASLGRLTRGGSVFWKWMMRFVTPWSRGSLTSFAGEVRCWQCFVSSQGF